MKRNLLLLVLFLGTSYLFKLHAQCSYGTPTVAATVAAPTTVGATITSGTLTDNQVYRVTGIVAGAVYRVYNCGSGFDTQITIFPSGGGTYEAYNDDNGPECTGTAASINYTPTVAGTKDIKLQRYNCSTVGNSNGTITVRLVSLPASSPCSAAINITSAPVTNQSLVCTSTAVPGNLNATNVSATCGGASNSYKGGQEALYTFTPATSGSYTISYSGQTWSAIFVYSGACPASGGTCVGSTGSSGSAQSLPVTLTAGTLYYIWFDTWPTPNSPCPGTFSIAVPASCNAPTGLTASSITSNSATVSWTAASPAPSSGYEWEVRTSGAGGSGATGLTTSGSTGAGVTSAATGAVLTGGTAYNLYVRSNCGGSGFSSWAGPYAFSTTCASSCNYTFRLTDSYGDGWNGATMQIRQGTTVLQTIGSTFISGTSLDISQSLCSGLSYNLYYVGSGTYPSEVGIQILDVNSTVIYTLSAGTGSTGTTLYTWTADCTAVFNPCSSITAANACGVTNTTTIAAGTGAYNPPSTTCGFSTPGQEKIYTFTPTVSGLYQIAQSASFGYIDYFFKAASGGCSGTGWTCIDDLNGASTSISSTFNLTAGTQYYILLDPESSTGGTVSFSIVCPAPPANDACANAINISSLPYTSAVIDNGTATDDYASSSSCDGPYKNVWWTVTGICGTMTASTCSGTNFDNEISVYTGACGSFTQVACNDDFCSTQASTSWTATAGTVYYITVGSYYSAGSTGNLQLNVTATPFTNSVAPTGISGTSTICAGGSTTLTLTGGTAGTGATAEWFSGSCGGTPEGTGNSITVSPGSTTTYFVRYNGTCNVTSCAQVTVTVNPNYTITASAGPNGSISPNGVTTLSCLGDGSQTYTITPDPGYVIADVLINGVTNPGAIGSGSYTFSNVSANYTISATFAVACTPPSITSVTAGSNPICPGSTTTLTANGVGGTGAIVTWYSSPNGGGVSYGTGPTLSNVGVGTYYARVTGDCTPADEESITIDNLAAPAITGISAGANPICPDGTTTLTANGVGGDGAVVTWWTETNGGGSNLGTGNTLNNVGPGTYYARVTGTCSPADEESITINSLAVPAISGISAGVNPVCPNGTTTLTANGVGGDGAVVNWWTETNGGGSNLGTGNTLNNVGPGTYYARVTGTCSPAVEASIEITSNGLNYFNLQWPPSPGSLCSGQSFTVYGQVWEPGVTPGSGMQGAGITAEFGYNTSEDTDPSTWTNWFAASFNAAGGGDDNDEYQYSFTPPAAGTYYYTYRYSLNGCDYQYGGYSNSGGGEWNGTSNVSGTVTVVANVDYYTDVDGDGYGTGTATNTCVQPPNTSSTAGDCDDAVFAINPGVAEVCNGDIDDDCDGDADDADSNVVGQGTYYTDNDADGYGTGTGILSCLQGTRSDNDDDCDDAVADINPAATETCAPGDEDCDGLINDADSPVIGQGTYYNDNDGDGYGFGAAVSACLQGALVSNDEDCDDAAMAINPDGSEICNGLDDDCDLLIDDADGSIFGQGVYFADNDGDGYGSGTAVMSCVQGSMSISDEDCDDMNEFINPDATEVCNGFDDDCDTNIDEGVLANVPTAPATYTSSLVNQADGATSNYTDACNVLAVIADAVGGNILGNTTVSSVLSASVPAPNAGGYLYGRRNYTVNATSTGPAILRLYFTQSDFDNYNSNNNTFLDLPTSGNNADPNKPYFRIARVSGGTYSITGPLGDSLTWNGTESRWEVNFPVLDANATYYFATMPSCDGIMVNNLQATQVQGSSIVATWDNLVTFPTNGWYSLQYRTTNPLGSWVDGGTSNGGTTSKFMIGFSPGTAYELQIRRHCSSQSTGPWSSSVFFTTLSPGCSSPPAMSVGALSATSATLSWPAITGAGWYEFRYSTVGTSGPWTSAGTAGGAATSRILSGLSASTTYYVQGRTFCASNGQPSEWGNTSFVTPAAAGCSLPPVMTATTINATNVTVTWPAVGGAGWFEFRYKLTSSGTWITAGTLTGSAVTKLFSGLMAGTSYDIGARSFCSNGQPSAWGVITVTTVGLAGCELPPVLNANPINATNVTLNWPAVTGAGWYEFRYKLSTSGTWISGGTLGGTANSKIFSGLTPETGYDFGARTFCSNGQPSAWASISLTTGQLVGCELPPTLSVGSVSTNRATLTWPVIGSAGWFEFRYSTSPTGPWTSGGTAGGLSTAKILNNLSVSTTYYAQARTFCASNGLPSAWSTNVSFTTTGAGLMSQPTSETIIEIQDANGENGSPEPALIILENDQAITERSNTVPVTVSDKMTIYPNPTKDYVTVAFSTENLSQLTLFVLDMTGRTLQQIEVVAFSGINTYSIDLGELPNGMYMIQLRDSGQLMHVGKVQKLD